MKTQGVTKFIKRISNGVVKHSPEILTGIGIAGMITTTVLAVKATPKAIKLIELAKEEKEDELTKTEVIKAAWKPYIPAAVTGAMSVACLVGGSSVHARRNAALMTAYQISTTALNDYKEAALEVVGEEQVKMVKDKVAKKKVEENPVKNTEVVITGKGKTLCYDEQGGRYFESDPELIKKAENIINKKLINEMYVSLNELYDEIGLRRTKLGDNLGWNIDDGLLEIEFSAQLSDDDQPCLVIDYSIAPRYDFSKLM